MLPVGVCSKASADIQMIFDGASSPAPANGRTCNCTTDLRWKKGPLACDAHVLNSTLLRSLAGKP